MEADKRVVAFMNLLRASAQMLAERVAKVQY